jgi:hypothetical protein
MLDGVPRRWKPTSDAPKLTVISGQDMLGHIVEASGRCEARTPAGELIGIFPTRSAAVAAFAEPRHD